MKVIFLFDHEPDFCANFIVKPLAGCVILTSWQVTGSEREQAAEILSTAQWQLQVFCGILEQSL